MPEHSAEPSLDQSIVAIFVSEWAQGNTPCVESFLRDHSIHGAAEIARVIGIDQQERWSRGNFISAEQYFQRLPILLTNTEAAFEIILQEYDLRQSTDNKAAEDLAQRFPSFADSLHRQITVYQWLDSSMDGFTHAVESPLHEAATPIRSLPPGIESRFEIIELIGRGGVGVVYRAVDRQLHREVAIKVLSDASLTSIRQQRRFQEEAAIVARMQHPNIVSLYEVVHDREVSALILEFIAGGTLAERIQKGPLPPGEAAQLVAVIARGVEYAHQRGVIHRDLKPSNILLSTEPCSSESGQRILLPYTPKITDFGLAKSMIDSSTMEGSGQSTWTGEILGTPRYLAPEQIKGSARSHSPSIDVHALGMILYELLVGRVPFEGPTVIDYLRQISEEVPRFSEADKRRVPRDLQIVCLKCLEKEPERRYVSAERLSNDLCRVLDGEPIAAKRTSTWQKLKRWGRHNPTAASLLGLVVFLILGGTWVITGQWYDAVAARRVAESGRLDAERSREEADQSRRLEEKARALAEQREQDANQSMYIARMSVARRQWESGDVAGVVETLGEMSEPTSSLDPRSFEYHHLVGLLRKNVTSLQGHCEQVCDLSLSKDGTRLLSLSRDLSLRVWDLKTERCLQAIPTFDAYSACISPDGSTAIVASTINEGIRVYSCANGQVLRSDPRPGSIISIACSPDSQRIAFATCYGEVVLTDALGGNEKVLCREKDSQFRGLVSKLGFSPDGKLLAVVGGPELGAGVTSIWDVESGKKVASFHAHIGSVKSLAFSPDGQTLATGGLDKTVRIWKTRGGPARGKPIEGHTGVVTCLQFSPDGRFLASGSDDQTVRLWSIPTFAQAIQFRSHSGGVQDLEFTPDSKSLLTAGLDREIHILRVVGQREYDTLEPPRRPLSPAARVASLVTGIDPEFVSRAEVVLDLAYSPDGRRLAVAVKSLDQEGRVDVWDTTEKRIIGTLPSSGRTGRTISSLRYLPNGHDLVLAETAVEMFGQTLVGPGSMLVWNPESKEPPVRWGSHESMIWSLALSPDGNRLASASADGWIKVWDLSTRTQVASTKAHHYWVCAVAYSPDGRQIASAGDDQSVHLWGAEKLDRQHSIRCSSSAYALDFSPDGRWLAIGTGSWGGHYSRGLGTFCLWDRSRNELVHETVTGSSLVRCVMFSPDGARLATAGLDGVMKLWDPRSGHEMLQSSDQTLACLAVRFSPDGKSVAAGGDYGSIRLWKSDDQTHVTDFLGRERDARWLIEQRRWREAKKNLDTTIELGTATGPDFAHRAWVRRELGDRDVTDDLSRAKELITNPVFLARTVKPMVTHQRDLASIACDQGDYPQAIQILDNLASLGDEFFEDRDLRAMDEIERWRIRSMGGLADDPDTAVSQALAILLRAPRLAVPNILAELRGFHSTPIRVEDRRMAEMFYRRLLDQSPNPSSIEPTQLALARIYLAEVLRESGKLNESLDVCRDAMKSTSDIQRSWISLHPEEEMLRLARAFKEKGDSDHERSILREMLSSSVGDSLSEEKFMEAWRMLGASLLREADERSIAAIQTDLKLLLTHKHLISEKVWREEEARLNEQANRAK